jgi:hypothetical protein
MNTTGTLAVPVISGAASRRLSSRSVTGQPVPAAQAFARSTGAANSSRSSSVRRAPPAAVVCVGVASNSVSTWLFEPGDAVLLPAGR